MASQLSGVLDRAAARLPTRPTAYLFLYLIWAVALWFLSSGSPPQDVRLNIPHLDKLFHFGYFFCGGAVLGAYGSLQWPRAAFAKTLIAVTLVCCIIGRLDEYHQGFVPGRSGNDGGDWLADTLGGLFGGLVFIRWILPRVLANQGDQ